MVKRSRRLISLDVFRGITIAGMILVNNPGSWSHLYPPLAHAAWNGWTPTDLVFPFFLFIMGVAMTYSFASMRRKGLSKTDIYKKVGLRSLLLFGIGLGMAIFPLVRFEPFRLYDFSTMRIMGVLQRIGLCYLFASVIYLEFQRSRRLLFWGAGLLIFYWIIMMTIPVPGHGPGVLTKEGNLATFIDKSLMPGHLWKPGWDPEGLLSTIPAIVTVIFGILAGKNFNTDHADEQKANRLFVFGLLALVAGLIASQWFPINKGLWTPSYVLFTGGFAMLFLGICYWAIDIKGYSFGTKPFQMLGMNALAVYVLSSLTAKLFYVIPLPASWGGTTIKELIYNQLILPLASPINASLLYAVLYVLIWTIIMAVFYRKKIFIKI